MEDKMQVCFDLNQDDYVALQRMAEVEDVSHTRYAEVVLSRHIREYADAKAQLKKGDRREYPRIAMSIPAVSCVRFSDTEMRSYPVVVEDISKGGLRISFKSVTQKLAEELSNSSFFEVVFTVPQLSQTVSLYCKRLRYNMEQGISMVGTYEGDNVAPLSLMNPMLEAPGAYSA
jgi:hypothetical protein